MRYPFTDGVNSFAHVLLGYVAAKTNNQLLVIGFVMYQLLEKDQSNTFIDLLEFAIGYESAKVVAQ